MILTCIPMKRWYNTEEGTAFQEFATYNHQKAASSQRSFSEPPCRAFAHQKTKKRERHAKHKGKKLRSRNHNIIISYLVIGTKESYALEIKVC